MTHYSLFAYLVCLTLFITPSFATPVACTDNGNVQQLINLNSSGGCLTGDVDNNNFQFTSTATGNGTALTAAQVSYLLDDPSTSTLTGQQIWGFEFDPGIALVGRGTIDILMQYDVIAPTAEITSLHLLETAVANGGGSSAVVIEGPDCGRTIAGGGCTFLPNLTVSTANPHEDSVGIGPFVSLHIIKDIVATVTSRDGSVYVSDVRDAVDVTPDAPEVSTTILGFSGIGLILLGRKRFSQQIVG